MQLGKKLWKALKKMYRHVVNIISRSGYLLLYTISQHQMPYKQRFVYM